MPIVHSVTLKVASMMNTRVMRVMHCASICQCLWWAPLLKALRNKYLTTAHFAVKQTNGWTWNEDRWMQWQRRNWNTAFDCVQPYVKFDTDALLLRYVCRTGSTAVLECIFHRYVTSGAKRLVESRESYSLRLSRTRTATVSLDRFTSPSHIRSDNFCTRNSDKDK